MKNHRMSTTLLEQLPFCLNAMFFHPVSKSDVYMSNNKNIFQK